MIDPLRELSENERGVSKAQTLIVLAAYVVVAAVFAVILLASAVAP